MVLPPGVWERQPAVRGGGPGGKHGRLVDVGALVLWAWTAKGSDDPMETDSASGVPVSLSAVGRSSGSRLGLLSTPSRAIAQWLVVDFVTSHSGGTAPEFHGIPN